MLIVIGLVYYHFFLVSSSVFNPINIAIIKIIIKGIADIC